MDDRNLSAGQLAASAECSFQEAQAAIYMLSSADNGWTLSEFCQKTGMQPIASRELAFSFGISFPDYDPSKPGMPVRWVKVPRKGWAAICGSGDTGSCTRQEDGRYLARFGDLSFFAWDARFAITRLGQIMDANAQAICGTNSIETIIENDGCIEGRFPEETGEVRRKRKALSARSR